MNSVQTLGQSLDHWQALYIIAIAVAFASTAAIVTFAFHIQEHRHGLKISNYIYVIASFSLGHFNHRHREQDKIFGC